jgi:hypothetical protein
VKEQERSRVKIDVNHRWLDLADPRDQKAKTINIRDSLVVTHPTTSLTAQCFSTAERTGSPIFIVLWSIAKVNANVQYINPSFIANQYAAREYQHTET